MAQVLVIKKAIKFGAKARLALYGPAGSGKTYSALKIGTALAGDKRVLVIDSERGSASKYADIFDFDTIELADFHPHTYVQAIRMAVRAGEYSVLIIDSITQEWDGTRGALELAGQDFRNWAKVTPLHNAFVDAMLSAPLHVIVTMRAKEEHVMEQVEGKSKPQVRSIGIEPIQRKGMQYEFDVVGSLDIDNTLTIVKSRCSALHNAVFYKAGQDIADVLSAWLDGAPVPVVDENAPKSPRSGQESSSTEHGDVSDTEQRKDSKERLKAIYSGFYRIGAFEKADSTEETQKNFYAVVSAILAANITAPGQLTPSRLDVLERHLTSQEAA